MTDIAIATSEALRELTGYVRPDAQRRWLDANGVRYVQDRRGHPKVAADVIAKLLGVRQAPPPREVGPDTDALKGALVLETASKKTDISRRAPACLAWQDSSES